MGKYPRDAVWLADNLKAAAETYVLPGFLPERPLIDRETRVRTLGSCFARHVATAIGNAGFKVKYASIMELINSPLANRLLFERVRTPGLPYQREEHRELFSEEICQGLREILPQEDLVIFTLGVAPVYYLKGSDVPSYVIDVKRAQDYEFRFTTVEQNEEAISFIVETLKILNPKVQIVLTISPVPLNQVVGIDSVVAADCVSKSTLRVAAFNYLSRKPDNVYYWPSFEIVRWLGAHVPPVYGAEDGNSRHVNSDVVQMIVDLFVKHYCEGNSPTA